MQIQVVNKKDEKKTQALLKELLSYSCNMEEIEPKFLFFICFPSTQ